MPPPMPPTVTFDDDDDEDDHDNLNGGGGSGSNHSKSSPVATSESPTSVKSGSKRASTKDTVLSREEYSRNFFSDSKLFAP